LGEGGEPGKRTGSPKKKKREGVHRGWKEESNLTLRTRRNSQQHCGEAGRKWRRTTLRGNKYPGGRWTVGRDTSRAGVRKKGKGKNVSKT